VILTSATLTVRQRFDFIGNGLGRDHAKERTLPPEFQLTASSAAVSAAAYAGRARRGFGAKAADEILRLLELSQGGRFAVFTSLRADEKDLYERVSVRSPYPLMLTVYGAAVVLLERFKTNAECGAVATVDFCKGGRAGQQFVVCDCGPIAVCVPSDHRGGAGAKRLDEEGRNAFSEYQVRRRCWR